MEEDRRTVLASVIRALAVQLRGIVVLPEDIEQLFIIDLGRIVFNLDCLGVSGAVAANVFVGRVRKLSAGVADAS